MTASGRNVLVERAVDAALARIDHFLSGSSLALPAPAHRRACETLLGTQRASIRTAALFLMFYWLQDPSWDLNHLPTGLRGQYGDKRLSEQLTRRSLTLHGSIVAFGENLGWKGNVRASQLRNDSRFSGFLAAIADATADERQRIADYLAQRFAESQRISAPLPPVGADILTFVRAKALFYELIAIKSEGHIQQFVVAALLAELRRHDEIEVVTHHPHAADAYDVTAGDIEERRGEHLVRAYEVTVRPDWQHRVSNFQRKMDDFGLDKYVIIASEINDTEAWSEPARMALALEPYGRDIAVIDIRDVINFLCAELSPADLRSAVNRAYEYLCNPKLSDRDEFKTAYVNIVQDWLDSVQDTTLGG